MYSQETEGKQKWAVLQGQRAEDCGTKGRGGGEVLGGGTEPIPHQLGVSGGPALAQTDFCTIFGLQMTTGGHDFHFIATDSVSLSHHIHHNNVIYDVHFMSGFKWTKSGRARLGPENAGPENTGTENAGPNVRV